MIGIGLLMGSYLNGKIGFWKPEKGNMSNFSTDNREIQEKIMKHGVLCHGDCGRVFIEEDLHQSCYGDLFCNPCMFNFVCEQEDFHKDMKGTTSD